MSWRALRVAAGGLIVGGVVCGAGVAGAAQQAADATITTDTSTVFLPSAVSVSTGDTVTWTFAGAFHNAQAQNDVPADPNWKTFVTPVTNTGSYDYTFTQPGSYQFHCIVHSGMTGTVTVTGAPVTPTPTPPGGTPTPAPTSAPPPPPPAATTTPTTPGTTTPPPGSAARDAVAPRISRVGLDATRRGVRVAFTLSETATVTVLVERRKSRKVVRTARLQVRAGKRALSVRGGRLARGRYVIELRARDSGGNVATERARLRVGKVRG